MLSSLPATAALQSWYLFSLSSFLLFFQVDFLARTRTEGGRIGRGKGKGENGWIAHSIDPRREGEGPTPPLTSSLLPCEHISGRQGCEKSFSHNISNKKQRKAMSVLSRKDIKSFFVDTYLYIFQNISFFRMWQPCSDGVPFPSPLISAPSPFQRGTDGSPRLRRRRRQVVLSQWKRRETRAGWQLPCK